MASHLLSHSQRLGRKMIGKEKKVFILVNYISVPCVPQPFAFSNCSIFNGLPETFEVARYHSLYGLRDKIPDCLDITAETEDGIVMGIKHKTKPYAAVQFHPESILTSPAHGMSMLKNALSFLSYESEVNGN